ncbi:UDP-2,4-diacetamido-2,4,6-trideoxy-beta-L-altropyranose hydrolase [Pseudomonas alcaligenes]|uniref:UDP-2,4-diacetamido-2,4, 6-trideoxy-beta-L-altropyranose hydrolase n=1 Tax=Aquipseudomonas alcaligenes TaxID=43263 RepID=A0ABR7S0I7_AQUAC|nr:UDP-2,4-diacetamido-2,4,6-trideoxy-beta-L-altropyranose hydrolase [Pseudomonas alcaligenes]MBC9251082.1 UDP-2,4-diacetamido-2,4,6-trideoxy-beta-L-altropyranose hydrolase [Pseudomonas alcaligenes]
MKVAFRTDASLQIGSGHLMRCLTLADALARLGHECLFICREHPGHLLAQIAQRGFQAHALPAAKAAVEGEALAGQPAHAAWLGCAWRTDVRQTAAVLEVFRPDWLIVDHYALDRHWEAEVRPLCGQLMVIDDLADRAHLCDLLLDQNLGRTREDYAGLLPAQCRTLIGPAHALLRPDFAQLREYSLQRRRQPVLRRLLITMGGVDQPNATGQVLAALKQVRLPADCLISVVMGLQAPWLEQVRAVALQMPWPTEVLVNVDDMAQRMAEADLAIGAAGSTSWERCCLGLPTFMLVLAQNQQEAALALERAGAVSKLSLEDDLGSVLPRLFAALGERLEGLASLTQQAAAITDGGGCGLLLRELAGYQEECNERD